MRREIVAMIRMFSIAVLVLVMLVGFGCRPKADSNSTRGVQSNVDDPHTIEIIVVTRAGCSTTPALLDNLRSAVDAMELAVRYRVIDQATLDEADPRSAYPTPTILLDNCDIFGLPIPEPPIPSPS